MLKARDLSITLSGKCRVESVSMDVAPGELVAIIGPNGAGKSTLLKIISGELCAASGTVEIGGKDRADWNRRELARTLAVMGQSANLAFDFTVRELVELGRAPHKGEDTAKHDKAIVAHAIALSGLSGFENRSVPSLSGGERQRAFFAKAVAQLKRDAQDLPGKGKLLLLDEPTSALDLAQQARVLSAARRVVQWGGAILCVLHDLNLAAAFADRICVLVDGQMVANGPPASILSDEELSRWYGCKVDVQPSLDGSRKVITLSSDVGNPRWAWF